MLVWYDNYIKLSGLSWIAHFGINAPANVFQKPQFLIQLDKWGPGSGYCCLQIHAKNLHHNKIVYYSQWISLMMTDSKCDSEVVLQFKVCEGGQPRQRDWECSRLCPLLWVHQTLPMTRWQPWAGSGRWDSFDSDHSYKAQMAKEAWVAHWIKS